MKFYTLETEFTFGKFRGKTLIDVMNEDPSYLDWCLINLDHFYISNETLEAIRQIKPNFNFSENAEEKRLEKYQELEAEQNDESEYDDFQDDYRHHYSTEELEMGDWDYDPMNPAHNPSDNPWINVFGPGDEAEAAYWNTD